MRVMGNTITRAASGETAENAAPKDSQSQAKGQKSNLRKFLYVILLSLRLEQIQSFFVFKNTFGVTCEWRRDVQ